LQANLSTIITSDAPRIMVNSSNRRKR